LHTLKKHRSHTDTAQTSKAGQVARHTASIEQSGKSSALLEILAMGTRQIENGEIQRAEDVINRIRKRRQQRND